MSCLEHAYLKSVIMFIALSIEELRINGWQILQSIDIPCSEVDKVLNTHPTPDPNCPLPPELANYKPRVRAATYNQYDKLFILGNAMSGAPIIKGMK
ncbi:MAG: hypothetical protein CM15mP98_04220 [Paracoccaceae bacterium]|nr:MAG: hypothetical protein CM15mP98_04220 [Paracoccaceae bacterium]